MTSFNELTPLILQNGPWSISKLGVIEQCSYKFSLKYGPEKVEEPKTENAESLVGVVVHRALELLLGGGYSTKQAFNQAIAEYSILSDQKDAVMAFYDQVENTVKLFANLRKVWGVEPSQNSVMIERKWGLDAGFNSTSFFDKKVMFRGVVDYGLLTAKNNVVIVDHKTGKRRELDYYSAQFKAYCLLALAKMPTVKAVQTGINFVLDGVVEWSPKPISAEQIREEYRPWLISYISKACEGLKTEPKPTAQKLCDWCGYKPICPAHGGAGRGNDKE